MRSGVPDTSKHLTNLLREAGLPTAPCGVVHSVANRLDCRIMGKMDLGDQVNR